MTALFKQSVLILIMLVLGQPVTAGNLPRMPDGVDGVSTRPEPRRGFKERFNAIESEKLRISLEGDSGFVEGKVCDLCEKITVTITPQTQAFENDNEVPLSRAAGRLGRYATVIYELDTKKVTQIRW